MFPAQYIAVAFLAMLFATFIGPFIPNRRGFVTFSNIMIFVGLICSIYCIAAGVSMVFEWADPTASLKYGIPPGRAGLVLLAVKFWPYVLIGIGGWAGWENYQASKYI
jgi:hypothetical protein